MDACPPWDFPPPPKRRIAPGTPPGWPPASPPPERKPPPPADWLADGGYVPKARKPKTDMQEIREDLREIRRRLDRLPTRAHLVAVTLGLYVVGFALAML